MCYSCPYRRSLSDARRREAASRMQSRKIVPRSWEGPGERSVEGGAHEARLGIETLNVGLPRPQRSGEQCVGSLSMPRTLDFLSCRERSVYHYPALRKGEGCGASCIKTASRRHRHARERSTVYADGDSVQKRLRNRWETVGTTGWIIRRRLELEGNLSSRRSA